MARLSDDDQKMFADFRGSYDYCWACGIKFGRWSSLDRKPEVHHIIGGSGRKHVRANLSLLCNRCHRLAEFETIRDDNGEPLPYLRVEHVLWLKRCHDPKFYDRRELDSLFYRNLPAAKIPDDLFFEEYYSRRQRLACDHRYSRRLSECRRRASPGAG